MVSLSVLRNLLQIALLGQFAASFLCPATAVSKTTSSILLASGECSEMESDTLLSLIHNLNCSVQVTFNGESLSQYDLVVVDGSGFSHSQLPLLEAFVEGGGNLVLLGKSPDLLAGGRGWEVLSNMIGAVGVTDAANGPLVPIDDRPYCLPLQKGVTVEGSDGIRGLGLLSGGAQLTARIVWSDSSLYSYQYQESPTSGRVFYLSRFFDLGAQELFLAAVSEMLELRIKGDVDLSGSVTISDAVQIVNYVFNTSESVNTFLLNGDVNCDQLLSVSDAIHMIRYIYQNGPPPCDNCYRGTVHVVFAVDTEPIDPASDIYSIYINLANYALSGQRAFVAQVMNDSYRSRFHDSYGNPVRFSWYLMSTESFCHSRLNDCNVIHAAMGKFIPKIHQYGDELAWHYHHAEWVQADWAPNSWWWSQIVSFDSTTYYHGTDIEIAERMLNHLLIDKGFFPSCFRSGWVWENTDFSNWLEQIIPYDFSNLSPHGTASAPLTTVFWDYSDWTRAPLGWNCYHPSGHDYQALGSSRRTIFRCNHIDTNLSTGGLSRESIEQAFRRAARGEENYLAVYSHSSYPLTDFVQQHWYDELHEFAQQYSVTFRFSTATEAARAVLGYDADTTAPAVTLSRVSNQLLISVNEPIFQRTPYTALPNGGEYTRIHPAPSGQNTWMVDLAGLSEIVVAVGVSDFAGNVATARYHSQEDVKRQLPVDTSPPIVPMGD